LIVKTLSTTHAVICVREYIESGAAGLAVRPIESGELQKTWNRASATNASRVIPRWPKSDRVALAGLQAYWRAFRCA